MLSAVPLAWHHSQSGNHQDIQGINMCRQCLCVSFLSCQTRSSLAAAACKLPLRFTSHGLSGGLCRCRGVGLLQCFGLSLHPRDSVAPDSQFKINLRQNEKNITSWIIPAVDAGFSRGSVVQYQTQLCCMTNIKEEKSAISVVDVVERSPAFSVPKITAPHAICSPPVFVFAFDCFCWYSLLTFYSFNF